MSTPDPLRSRVEALREAVLACIPGNWIDPLLTGPDAVIRDSPPPEIEALLKAVRGRVIEALAAHPEPAEAGLTHEQALDAVVAELSALSQSEFDALLEKHADGDFTQMLRQSTALSAPSVPVPRVAEEGLVEVVIAALRKAGGAVSSQPAGTVGQDYLQGYIKAEQDAERIVRAVLSAPSGWISLQDLPGFQRNAFIEGAEFAINKIEAGEGFERNWASKEAAAVYPLPAPPKEG